MLLSAISSSVRIIAGTTGRRYSIGKLFLNSTKIPTSKHTNLGLRYLCLNEVPVVGTPAINAAPSENATPTKNNVKDVAGKSTNNYAAKITSLLQENKVKAAIKVLEDEVIKEHGVKPSEELLFLLIDASGRLGFAKKCYQMFKLMKEYGMEPSASTYTALFSACENTPFLQDGLNCATRTRHDMLERKFEPDESLYELMIKSFARCRDMETACTVLDEAHEKGRATKDAYKYLLYLAADNSENGFLQALTVWHKIHEHNVKPDISLFHLMLNCVRDSGIGNEELARDVIENIIKKREKDSVTLPSGDNQVDAEEAVVQPALNTTDEFNDGTPNLLSKNPRLGTLISLGEIKEAEHRLLLLGGVSGFLAELKSHDIKPSIGTFQHLLQVIPLTLSAEDALIFSMKNMKILLDVDFYNALLKRRCTRVGYDKASVSADLNPLSCHISFQRFSSLFVVDRPSTLII